MAALEKGGRATLMRALRNKYRTPREALKALGLDQSLLDVDRLAFDGDRSMNKPTRLEFLAVTRAARAINPTLAADAQIDYAPIFKGLNTKNFKARKPTIVSDMKRALAGKVRKTLGMDAPMEHLAHLLNEMEHVKEPKSLDASVSAPQHRAMEAAAHGHSNLGIPKEVGKEFEKKDKGKSFGDANPSANLGHWMKKKGMSDDAVKRCMDMIRDELPENALDGMDEGEIEIEIESGSGEFSEEEAEDNMELEEGEDRRDARDHKDARDRRAKDSRRTRDGEIEEEEAEDRHARDGEIEQEEAEGSENEEEEAEDRHGRDSRRTGRDSRRAKDRKGAMDGKKYITVDAAERIARSAVATERKRTNSIQEARAFCRPYVGDLPMALDSAEAVYKAAARARGIEEADEIHEPVALRALIKFHGPAGARAPSHVQLTQDEKGDATAGTLLRFPGLGRIGNA